MMAHPTNERRGKVEMRYDGHDRRAGDSRKRARWRRARRFIHRLLSGFWRAKGEA